MIIQSCPRCGSSRIRRGYRPTPWWWAIFGHYNLLCNSCNWEFVGLALPGTVPEHLRKRKKQTDERNQIQSLATVKEVNSFAEIEELSETISLNDADCQKLEEVIDNLSITQKQTPLTVELEVNINNSESSATYTVTGAIDKTKVNIDEIPKLLERDKVCSLDPEELKVAPIDFNKAEQQRVKSKKRARAKRKK